MRPNTSLAALAALAAILLFAARLGAADGAANALVLPRPALPTVVKLSPEIIGAFRYSLEKSRQTSALPGMAVVVIQPGQTLLLDGFGRRSNASNDTVTPDTRFALGPASAAINSLLLTRLSAQNKLDLEAPAYRCWDEFKFADTAAARSVTLRHLLAMTAGLPARTDSLLKSPGQTPADLFAIAAQIPVLSQPGRAFNYSDTGAALAGYLAVYAANQHSAPAAGLPAGFSALATAQLLIPLGMKRATYFPPASATSDDDATGHTRDARNPWIPAPPVASSQALLPALGLRSSARDVAAWLQFELSGGVDAAGQRLLDEAAVQGRWRPKAGLDSHGYGLGWSQQYYRGLEIIGHLGEQDHQSALVAIVPQYRTALAILTNGGGRDAVIFLQDALLNFADLLREAAELPAK